jgi:hypothetical protein
MSVHGRPRLPSDLFMMVMDRLHPYIRTFGAALTAVPDGIGWSAPSRFFALQSAADILGLADHGLTCFAITA